MTRYLRPADWVFRKRNSDGRHRRQRVVAGQLFGYATEYIGNLLYYVGSSLIRARRNRFRRIRHGSVKIFRSTWTERKILSTSPFPVMTAVQLSDVMVRHSRLSHT